MSWLDIDDDITFYQYEEAAGTTAIYPNKGENPCYPALGLAGEAGEVAEKVKKLMRDDGGKITDAHREAMRKELGDVLWYVAALAHEYELDMEDIASFNIEKLRSRMDRDKLKGSGDDR